MIKKIVMILGVSTMMFAADGAALLKNNCASCHLLTTPTPDMIPTMKAPAMEAVALHVKMVHKTKEAQKNFIVDYALNPDVSKSVCESNKVQKFGVMPSVKGKVSKQDLEYIAEYITAHYPTEKFSAMIAEIQRNDKMNALLNSPFLINKDGLPHLTKLLIQNWDKATLGLTPEQKKKLLVIRKETLGSVKKIKQQTTAIENAVVNAMTLGEDYTELSPKIDELAKLKAEATKAHLKCIAKTLEVLNDEQVEFLLPYLDY